MRSFVAVLILLAGVLCPGFTQEAAGVADLTLEALRGLDLATITELKDLLGSAGGGGSEVGESVAIHSSLPGGAAGALKDVCGSPDSLTNLLVYQYLMGSLNGEEDLAGAGAGRSNSQTAALQALLGETPEISTRVTVSTSLTTSTVPIDPTTRFLTSSTTYTTTVTNVDTKVIPLIFRGSKVTTTFSESSTEVIVATEFMTTSTVLSPTIVQTLPVHITMTATSTKGFDGRFTLADVVTGPSTVINQPIATATVDLDATGLLPSNIDINNLDLSQYDLSSLANAFGVSDNDQMVSALTALIQQYGAEPPKQVSSKVTSSGKRKRPNKRPRTRFEDELLVDPEEPPKFNVLKGFTLSDRPSGAPRPNNRRRPAKQSGGSGGGSGSAATATRYSKYHKRPKPENNGIAGKSGDSDRESERYSASTRRRTFSQATAATGRSVNGGRKRNKQSPSNRFVGAEENKYYEDTTNDRLRGNGKRNNRHIESLTSRRKSSLTQDLKAEEQRNNAAEKPENRLVTLKRFTSRGRLHTSVEKVVAPGGKKLDRKVQTTVLTMFVSGTKVGDFSKVLRTVTLRGLQGNQRSKRHAIAEPSISPFLNATKTHTPESQFQTNIVPSLQQMKPEQVVKILKTLDKEVVRRMLKSLSKWVNFYTHELVDDTENDVHLSQSPMLQSSLGNLPEASVSSSGTTSLPPFASASKSLGSEADLCSPPKTVTETVYQTVLVNP